MDHIFFIHSSVDGHLGCFHILAIVNNAAMNIGVHVSFQMSVFGFLGYTLRSGIAGPYGRSIFSFWRNWSWDLNPVSLAPKLLFLTTSHHGGGLSQQLCPSYKPLTVWLESMQPEPCLLFSPDMWVGELDSVCLVGCNKVEWACWLHVRKDEKTTLLGAVSSHAPSPLLVHCYS